MQPDVKEGITRVTTDPKLTVLERAIRARNFRDEHLKKTGEDATIEIADAARVPVSMMGR